MRTARCGVRCTRERVQRERPVLAVRWSSAGSDWPRDAEVAGEVDARFLDLSIENPQSVSDERPDANDRPDRDLGVGYPTESFRWQ